LENQQGKENLLLKKPAIWPGFQMVSDQLPGMATNSTPRKRMKIIQW
jgi:hypothetical protein